MPIALLLDHVVDTLENIFLLHRAECTDSLGYTLEPKTCIRMRTNIRRWLLNKRTCIHTCSPHEQKV
jgi:hypothetical protein